MQRKPEWLKVKVPLGVNYSKVNHIVNNNNLHTICVSGNCPNQAECWERGTATFMILGDVCTRACKFCNVKTGKPLSPDKNEPMRIAKSVNELGLKHVVLTSVDRDDLPDGGAEHWAETIRKVKELNPETTLEVLIPDFNGDEKLIQLIIDAKPEVVSHNMETVRRLTPLLRSKAKYDISMNVLKYLAIQDVIAKTGIMVGIGEIKEEVIKCMKDVRALGVDVFTIGQYLQPTKEHYPVFEYTHPSLFMKYKEIGVKLGFKHVESSPLVRSSYRAEQHIK